MNHDKTVLYIGESRDAADLVRNLLESFGFGGDFVSVRGAYEAEEFLGKHARERGSISIILAESSFTDGAGAEVLRAVKQNPLWRATPVIILSDDPSPEKADNAYRLGASCFLSKASHNRSIVDTLEALYRCWFDIAIWPSRQPTDRAQAALAIGVRTRARLAELLTRVARKLGTRPEAEFWLDLALNESNLSNIAAFLLPNASEKHIPSEVLDRYLVMHQRIEAALEGAEYQLNYMSPSDPLSYCTVFVGVGEILDEWAVIEMFRYLLQLNPVATAKFRDYVAQQLSNFSNYLFSITDDEEIRSAAWRLQSMSKSLVTHAQQNGSAAAV